MVDLSRIISVVTIEGLRLCEAHCRSWVQPSDTADVITVNTSQDAAVIKDPGDDGSLRIEATFKLEVHGADDDDRPQAEVRAAFELSYRIPGDEHFSSEELAAFARTNAVFNAWPYWREFVQASLARMSMPALTVPLFRLSPQDRNDDEEQDVAQEPVAGSGATEPTAADSPARKA